MVNILGFDVGGVNIKGAFIAYSSSTSYKMNISSKYYPMWLNNPAQFPTLIKTIISELANNKPINKIGLTMTAEVSDAYFTKKEGVMHILTSFSEILPQIPKKIISINNTFISLEEAMKNYMAVASANWVATGLFVGKIIPKCILLDIGSTTTDLIPVSNGLPNTIGKTDLARLLNGELIYTGALRSTIPSVVHKVPIRGELCPISFEKFALIADIHLLLDHIKEELYICDTADGRQKTKRDAFARLARVVCADIELLSQPELLEIAEYIYNHQLDQIREGLMKILTTRENYDLSTPIVVTGLGREFLAKRVAAQIGFREIIDLESHLGLDCAIATPAAAIALLLAEKFEE